MNIETANRLLKYRKKFGFSQEELAEKIGVSRQAVSKWERAEAAPDTDNLIILAEVYGVTIDELLRGTGEPSGNKAEDFSKVETEENTTYEKDDRFSFKKAGIHVHDGDDKVDISLEHGINVQARDGSYVHVGKDGVCVNNGEKVCAYTDENGHLMVDSEMKRRTRNKKIAHIFPMWFFALAAMMLWGYSGALCGFALSWVCLLAIPIYHTLVSAIYKRDAAVFAYPVVCVVFQMLTGFLINGWAWSWFIYLTIPVYYCIVKMIKSAYGTQDE
ncbi:MAG: helix-turn-helix transcriptional regulator [Ruminococcus sp.]|nr:helix-turn-helix transcriptional regulator [Ruminococcus sp.]